MSDTTESNDERPCLHCLIGDVIDEFYAEYGSLSGEKDTSMSTKSLWRLPRPSRR
jgi:hypothetical protein